MAEEETAVGGAGEGEVVETREVVEEETVEEETVEEHHESTEERTEETTTVVIETVEMIDIPGGVDALTEAASSKKEESKSMSQQASMHAEETKTESTSVRETEEGRISETEALQWKKTEEEERKEEKAETVEESTEVLGLVTDVDEGAKVEEGVLPDLNAFSEEDQAKIVKMQAQGRGYIARKQVAEKKASGADKADDSEATVTEETATVGAERDAPTGASAAANAAGAPDMVDGDDGAAPAAAPDEEEEEVKGDGVLASTEDGAASSQSMKPSNPTPPTEETEPAPDALTSVVGQKGGFDGGVVEAVAAVTFVVKPENIKYQREVGLGTKCSELKQELYKDLHILPNAISLRLGAAEWQPGLTLADMGVKAGEEVEIELVIDLGSKPAARAPVEPGVLPEYIEVHVEMGPGQGVSLIQVHIDKEQQAKKPYLGGFRDKRHGTIFHHAFTQTPRKPKYSEADRKLSRETQTYEVKTLRTQTVREQGTQMRRPGILLDETNDYIIIPGPYMTADELLRLKEQKTVIIQCLVRGWLARRRANELRKQKLEREMFLRDQEERRREEEAAKRQYEIQRRMHPRTAADFEILYNELEAWRLQETAKIKGAGLAEEARAEALQQLLSKETRLLQTIDRLKMAANAENKAMRIEKTLKDMSTPKKWDLANGAAVQVHTPFTTRSKELAQLYNGLNLPLLTTDERLDVLLHVKWTVKEFDCNLTREVVELVDREADLLNRGRSPKTMEGLRKRISSLFLAFIETPEFNPEAGRFQIVPLDFDGYQQSPLDGQAPRSFGTVTG